MTPPPNTEHAAGPIAEAYNQADLDGAIAVLTAEFQAFLTTHNEIWSEDWQMDAAIGRPADSPGPIVLQISAKKGDLVGTFRHVVRAN